jgi:hypothetical protein
VISPSITRDIPRHTELFLKKSLNQEKLGCFRRKISLVEEEVLRGRIEYPTARRNRGITDVERAIVLCDDPPGEVGSAGEYAMNLLFCEWPLKMGDDKPALPRIFSRRSGWPHTIDSGPNRHV